MSTLAVTSERLTILPHPNADALELAQVGGFRAVVAKDKYRTGEFAIYIPEQAILPDPLIEELGLTGRLAGPKANRVKAVRLRGELSQGIVCRPIALAGHDLSYAFAHRTDFASDLRITKWVPEIPANMSGEVVAASNLMRWLEVENIKRYPELFRPGELVTASEKAHGTCCAATLICAGDGEFFVSSKGFAGKGLALKEDPNNLYWRALRVHDVESKLRRIALRLGAVRIGLFGEVFGTGVQDLTYGVASRNEPGYAAFDAFVERPSGSEWIDQKTLRALLDEVGIAMMPELYAGPYNYERLAFLAEGSTVLGRGAHLREGLVVRPQAERYSELLGGRTIAKFINPAYLTRKNGTEYE